MPGLVLAVGVSVMAACGDDATPVSQQPPAETTSSSSSTPTTTPDGTTSTSFASTSSTAPPRDWDDVRFDFGDVVGVEEISDLIVLYFDRYQLYVADGLESAPDFTTEPVLYGNTGVESVNDNTRIRSYTMHAEAEILVLGNSDDVCNSQGSVDPRWDRLSRSMFLSARPWEDFGQVSVTFDEDGLVERLRFATGC